MCAPLAAVCAAVAWSMLAAGPGPCRWLGATSAHAASQLLVLPLRPDPLDLPSPQRAEFSVTSLRTRHAAHVESYDLGGWLTLGARHAVAAGLSYVGVETADRFRWGGGPPWVRWSSHTAAPGRGGLAVDAVAVLPFGDADLYPVATRAATFLLRGRVSVWGAESWRLWAGVWGRRVSPPSDRDRPSGDFPSGAGLDAYLQARTGAGEGELVARLDRAGLPESAWLQAGWSLPIGSDLSLRLAASTSIGPRTVRPIDSSWALGLQWRPTPPPPPSTPPSASTAPPALP